MRYVHVQSVLPEEDVIALKIKTGEASVKEAISKAVYYYLEYGHEHGRGKQIHSEQVHK